MTLIHASPDAPPVDILIDMELAAGSADSLFAIGSVEDGTLTLLPIVADAAMAGAEATPMATPMSALMATPAATPMG